MSLLLHNGLFYTLRRETETATALAIEGGRIAAIGPVEELRRGYPGAEEIDLQGRAAAPGFTDSHLHLLSYGMQLRQLSLSDVRSIAELKRRVGERAAQVKPGEWVLGRGWDQDRFVEGRYPTRYDLDAVAPDTPVFLRRACGHAAVANSAALHLAGVDDRTPDPAGGRFDRDPETGELTGVMREKAAAGVQVAVPRASVGQREDALRAAIQRAWQAGVTAVHANDVGEKELFEETWQSYQRIVGDVADGKLPFRLFLDPGIDTLDVVRRLGLVTGSGNAFLRMGSIKLFADGSLGASTAALYDDYADEPGNRGILVTGQEELAGQVLAAHVAGMQVAVHVIGDRAAGAALQGIRRALKEQPRKDHRHRLIHCQILSESLMDDMAATGVVADVQPKFVTTDMLWAERRVGLQRARTSYAWRSLLDRGVPVAFGSDAPVEPIDPVLGIYAAVKRQDMEGNPEGGWFPEQRLSVYEALRGFCLGGAYADFSENLRGTLEPGKQADVVVFDRNPFSIRSDELKQVRVEMTIAGGHVVYSSL